eukprot:TRINITY_DN6930_c0_g1_i2.p1 TRINITY_DN6930_c0_g1~~TRINITY_DN6930_c0_g1_i2.p1  ORF type:complete len:548 (-),score=152.69 TRINITY_DN6930_c0_g1_i2:542-2185(-)
MHPQNWGILGAAIFLPFLFIQANCDIIIERADNRRPFRIYDDQPARFGNALPPGGLVGLVVPANPIHGCGTIDPPPKDNVTLPKNVYFISLIRRSRPGSGAGECTFQAKVENAQAAGYNGVIVFNYLDDDLIPMGGDADVLIPSVFVGKTDGEKILGMFSYPTLKFYVRITENPPFDINSYLLPFAVVVGICFLIMFGIMVFKCIQDRRRERRHRLPKSSLKKIPTKKFTAEDESRYETCCICLEDYELGDKLRILPCNHAYHMKCIDPWLLKNKRVCPQCRKKVFASGEIPPSDTESETEDERAPLLARPRLTTGGTFTTQNENPFRRAARRLARRGGAGGPSGSSSSDNNGRGVGGGAGPPVRNMGFAQSRSQMPVRSSSPGASSTDSSSTEGGQDISVHNNQLVTQVYIEQPSRMTNTASPTPPPPSTSDAAPCTPTTSSPPPAPSPAASSTPTTTSPQLDVEGGGKVNDATIVEINGAESATGDSTAVTVGAVGDSVAAETVNVVVDNGGFVDDETPLLQSNQDEQGGASVTGVMSSNEDPIV